jgi:GT2 family glycosyltransferase
VNSAPGERVVALVVSHDGARWLPSVISGIQGQRVSPGRVVGVDTGSKDASADQLEAAFGAPCVVRAPSSTSFPVAVRLGLEHADRQPRRPADEGEWVWILHDDANPAPDALAELLAAAEADPEADVLGPKLREWPSLRRLLEVGVTISGTGRRETGLERGEYDQGQHDDVRRVLAVNTAGMLVRRSVLEELGGFDEQLAVFGNDIDFGWRAAAAGHKTIIVPSAVVFHVEAAHRGVRRTPLTGRHTHYQERRAALYTLLVNARGRSLPWQVVRLGMGTLLRVVGFLLVRSVGQALDELAALVSLYGSPRQILAARRERRRQRQAVRAAGHDEVRGLLAPWWLPYRHGLDVVSDLVTALTLQAQDVAERRRAAAAAAELEHTIKPRRPTHDKTLADDDEGPEADSGLVARFLTNPVALGLALFVVLVLFGAREAIGPVSGGGLSAAPADARELWRLHTESWHALGQGTAVPAPPYVVVLAALGAVLGSSASAAVSAILLLAVPVALWGAWRFLRVVGHLSDAAGAPRWLLAVASCTYALVPVVSGAWGDGRLGIVVVTAVLPWLGHAALGFADPEPDRRWRAAWRSGVLLALVAAFTPVAWFFAVALCAALVGVGFGIAPALMRDRSVWGPPATMLACVPLLLSPWWLPAIVHGAARSLLLDSGRLPEPDLGFQELLGGRLPGDLGAPWWLGLALLVMAVAALIPSRSRIPVLVVWIVALVAAATSAALSAVRLDLPIGEARPGLGFFLVVLRGAFVVAAFLAIHGLATRARRTGTPLRRLLPVALTGVAAVVPVLGLAWFVLEGPGQLTDDRDTGIPAYMVQDALRGPAHGILVIRGSVDEGLTYAVRRGDGVTLGEDEILAATPADAAFDDVVQDLTSQPRAEVVAKLADAGIKYVVLPAPADGDVAAGLDASAGLDQASAEDRSTRAWQVSRAVDEQALAGPDSWLRVALLVVQGVALLVVLVLCAPTSAQARRRAEADTEADPLPARGAA